jgi:N6-L-threonylcarbamoyladenine synthase
VEQAALRSGPSGFDFPRPYLEGSFDFSFSGLKTAVAYKLRDMLGPDFYEKRLRPSPPDRRKICLAFEEAVADTLVHKTARACAYAGVRRVIVGEGVAANLRLRRKFLELDAKAGYETGFAEKRYCTDNAAMVALCGARRLGARAAAGSPDIAPDLAVVSWS